jgi:hypothetical protein
VFERVRKGKSLIGGGWRVVRDRESRVASIHETPGIFTCRPQAYVIHRYLMM